MPNTIYYTIPDTNSDTNSGVEAAFSFIIHSVDKGKVSLSLRAEYAGTAQQYALPKVFEHKDAALKYIDTVCEGLLSDDGNENVEVYEGDNLVKTIYNFGGATIEEYQ